MGARVDRRGRLALQLLERREGVGERCEPACACFDVGTDEQPVLVQRPLSAVVRFEGERDLGAGLHVLREQREARQSEQPKGAMELRSAHGHELPLRAARLLSYLWHVWHQ
jgi:hypothetical protein